MRFNNLSYTPNYITKLGPKDIFVFGSNLKGMHNGGAAALARKWGAIMGQGEGLQGQTYAIPTMFSTFQEIKPYVDRFIEFAKNNPEKNFLVTKIGCGIAAFEETDIAPLFTQVVDESILNVSLPETFIGIICGNNLAID